MRRTTRTYGTAAAAAAAVMTVVISGCGDSGTAPRAAAAPAAAASRAGTHVLLDADDTGAAAPFRVADTRTSHRPLAARTSRAFVVKPKDAVLARTGVPAPATGAVELTVTVVDPGADGYVSVWADGTPQPATSTVDFVAGRTTTAAVVTATSAANKVRVYLGSSRPAHVVLDASGYFLAGTPTVPGAFRALRPARLRTGPSVAPGASARVPVLGRAGVPAAGVRAVALHVVANRPAAGGYAVVHAGGTPRPGTRNVSYLPGHNAAAAVVTPVGRDGAVAVDNVSRGRANLVVDVLGYYLRGTPTVRGTYVPVAPTRLVDQVRRATVPVAGFTAGQGPVPASGVDAVVLSATVAAPTRDGDLLVSGNYEVDGDYAPGPATSLHFTTGAMVTGLAVADAPNPPYPDSQGTVLTALPFPRRTTTVRLIADVLGYYRA